MKKLIAVLSFALFVFASVPNTGIAQESLPDPDGGKGPKHVFCVKTAKVKFGVGSSGPSVGIEVAFGEKTKCKAAFQEACTPTDCL